MGYCWKSTDAEETEYCLYKHSHNCRFVHHEIYLYRPGIKHGSLLMLVMTIINNYLLTPWSRVLLEKLTGSAASQEIPRIFGTWRFLTVLTSARHLSLSWANSIQSPQPPPTSWRSVLILSSHLCLGLPMVIINNNNNLIYIYLSDSKPFYTLSDT